MWTIIGYFAIFLVFTMGVFYLSALYNKKYYKPPLSFWDKANGITPELKKYFLSLTDQSRIKRRTIGRPWKV
jgi:uncharacterized membrane protein YbaN (DUF454 family)